jgi:hypothetical protein
MNDFTGEISPITTPTPQAFTNANDGKNVENANDET